MSIENEVKKLREAVEANTAAIEANGIPAAPPIDEATLLPIPDLQQQAPGAIIREPTIGSVPPAIIPVQQQPVQSPVATPPVNAPVNAPVAATGPSSDEVNSILIAEAARIGPTGPTQIVALLGKYGGSKITLIDPAYYPQILGEIAAIPAGA